MARALWNDYRDFVGFYWTLPLPSAGFTTLPDNADEAARLSRTIRYQRDRVRSCVAEWKGRLLDEIVWLETQPDRGTDYVEEKLQRALRICKDDKAQLLYVDFSYVAGWRQHPFLARLMQRAPVSCLGLDPEPMVIDGTIFDPIAHFRQHRDAARKHSTKTASKADLAARVSALAAEIGEAPSRYDRIAERLNEISIPTVTGRPWTAGNVKQFLATIKRSPNA